MILSGASIIYLNNSLKTSQEHIELIAKVLKNHEDALTDHRGAIIDLVDHIEGNFL